MGSVGGFGSDIDFKHVPFRRRAKAPGVMHGSVTPSLAFRTAMIAVPNDQ